MKTTYLDNEIILLEGYKKDGTISHYQNRKLAEYKQIKKLLLHNVVGLSEQLVAFLEFIEGYKMLEVDLEYEEIVRRFLGN